MIQLSGSGAPPERTGEQGARGPETRCTGSGMALLVGLLLCGALGASCSPPRAHLPAGGMEEIIQPPGAEEPMEVWLGEPETIEYHLPQDPYEMLTAELDGDEIQIEVRVSEACESRFGLVADPYSVRFGEPPEVELLIAHEAGGTGCERTGEHRLHFDLTPLRRGVFGPRYSDLDNDELVIVIRLADHRLRYAFDPSPQ